MSRVEGSVSIPRALAHWATATPDATALIEPGRPPAKYRELHQAVAGIAAGLGARGLRRGDGIALLMPDGLELSAAILAAISAGIAIPVTWPSPAAELQPLLASGRVRAILTTPEGAEDGLTRHGLPVLWLIHGAPGRFGETKLGGPAWGPPAPDTEPTGDDVALILRSSGTTGRPKLIPRLHRSIVANCQAVLRHRVASAADCALTVARPGYSQGFNLLAFSIFTGASLVLGAASDLDALPAWLEEYRPTSFSTSPAILRSIAAVFPDARGLLSGFTLTRIHTSAGPLAATDLDRLEGMFGLPILNSYGLSEASGIAGEPFPRRLRIPGSVGPPWTELAILDDRDQLLAPGATGQIAVGGPTLFPGYLDDPAANAAAFLPGGRFRTGDLGFLDDAGYLHLTGRTSEVVNRGGEKIDPLEVDRVLEQHPAVAEAAVFAIPDPRLGEDVVAAVVPRPEPTASRRELRDWMLDRLTAYKVPRRIWFIERLPRTPTGKVQRGELARRWQEAQADR